MTGPGDDTPRDEAGEDDHGDLRRRTFLERNDWIPWVLAAGLVGGALGVIVGHG